MRYQWLSATRRSHAYLEDLAKLGAYGRGKAGMAERFERTPNRVLKKAASEMEITENRVHPSFPRKRESS